MHVRKTWPEEKLGVFGVRPAVVIGLASDVWFGNLDSEQISFVEQFLSKSRQDS